MREVKCLTSWTQQFWFWLCRNQTSSAQPQAAGSHYTHLLPPPLNLLALLPQPPSFCLSFPNLTHSLTLFSADYKSIQDSQPADAEPTVSGKTSMFTGWYEEPEKHKSIKLNSRFVSDAGRVWCEFYLPQIWSNELNVKQRTNTVIHCCCSNSRLLNSTFTTIKPGTPTTGATLKRRLQSQW